MELSNKAQQVLAHWQAQYTETSRGLKTWQLATGEWINESDIDELVAVGLVDSTPRPSLVGPLQVLNAKGLATVVTPTSAAVAITNADAVDNAPSEVKANDGQPSKHKHEVGETIYFKIDAQLCGVITSQVSIGYTVQIEGERFQRRIPFGCVLPQPMIEREIEQPSGAENLLHAGFDIYVCPECYQQVSDGIIHDCEFVLHDVPMPSGWVADALATVNVTSEAAANDEYLPPTVEDNDDLPFSDLGEDETFQAMLKSIPEGATPLDEYDSLRSACQATIASLEARVKELETENKAFRQFEGELWDMIQQADSSQPIVDEIETAIKAFQRARIYGMVQ